MTGVGRAILGIGCLSLLLGLGACGVLAVAVAGSGPAAGSIVRIDGRGDAGVLLIVNEGAYLMVERARRERDRKTEDWALKTYAWRPVAHGERARVLAVKGTYVHLEMLGEYNAGRRGYVALENIRR